MLITPSDMCLAGPNRGKTTPPAATRKRRQRRGATALEYLVMITFILVVVILAVQHLGQVAGGILSNNAKATSKTIDSSKKSGQ